MVGINNRSTAYQGAMTTQGDSQWSLKHFIIFLVLGVISAGFTSYFLDSAISNPGIGIFVKTLIGCSILLAVLVFQALVVRDLQFFIWLALIEAIALAGLLYNRFTVWLAFGVFFFVVFAAIGFWRGQEDINNHLKVSFRRFAKAFISYATLGLSIFLALTSVGLYQKSGTVSPEVVRGAVAGSVPAVRTFLPDFELDMSFEQFLESIVDRSLAGRSELASLPVANRNQLFSELAGSLEERIAKFTKIEPVTDESVSGYTYRAFANFLSAAEAQGFGDAITTVMIFTLFFFFRGVFYLVKWPIVYFGYSIYGFLLSTGVIFVLVEPRNKEVVVVK